MMEFNIGDRVKSLPHKKYGVIEDKLYSNKLDCWLYTVALDGSFAPLSTPITADNLEPEEASLYRWEVFKGDNVVTAVLYEIKNGVEREVARNHGHIMHSGIVGVAQAASFAMKKIYVNMNDGKLIGSEDS